MIIEINDHTQIWVEKDIDYELSEFKKQLILKLLKKIRDQQPNFEVVMDDSNQFSRLIVIPRQFEQVPESFEIIPEQHLYVTFDLDDYSISQEIIYNDQPLLLRLVGCHSLEHLYEYVQSQEKMDRLFRFDADQLITLEEARVSSTVRERFVIVFRSSVPFKKENTSKIEIFMR